MTTSSVASRTLPQALRPMLARLARRPFNSPDHIYELKWDGIRTLAFVEGRSLRLLSRNSVDITTRFPELLSLPRHVRSDEVVLDGELVCLDHRGQPSYTQLRRRLMGADHSTIRRNPVHFIVFDVLYSGGRSVMREPLSSRKNMLHDVLEPSDIAQACDFIDADGEAFFQATCDLGLEGMVAKEKSSLYLPGKRSQYWLKVKRVRESEFVIGGYTFGGVRKERFSSLLLGLYDNDGQFIFVGQVGTGISKSLARQLSPELQQTHSPECPFDSLPNVQKFIFWCRPELVCQVEYGEFTEDGKVAYPVFKSLRDDKPPEECMIADAPGWPQVLADFT